MNRFMALVAGVALVLGASSAHAATIGYATVGLEDTLVGGFNVGNSEAAEQDLLFNYLKGMGWDPNDLSYNRVDVVGELSYVEVTGEPGDWWAIDFSAFGLSNVLAFVVRFGNAEYTHYLYENVSNMQYGVVDLSDIKPTNGKITIESISHTGIAVPEPGTLSLMFFGLVALGASSRRHRAAA